MSSLSFEFWGFCAAVLVAYYMMPLRVRWLLLAAASAVFVLSSGWQGAAYLAVVSLCTWLGGLALERLRADRPRRARGLLVLLLALDLGGMALFKYAPAATRGALALAAPLGLSYFTFQSAGLLIDVFRGKAQPPRSPAKVWLFLSYFPQLAQGPISTWKQLGAQLTQGHRLTPVTWVSGAQLVLWGCMKKLVIADRLAPVTAALETADETLPGWLALLGLALYALRLYADFSGGVDVARGISRMLGIELPENFKRPFFARSVADYWRRWHITLGAWFRAYVLYPMTAGRAGLALGRAASRLLGERTGSVVPTALATLFIFLLIGLWHGASLNAVVYGVYFGLIMAFSVLMEPVYKRVNRALRLGRQRSVRALRMVRTWLLILPAQAFAFTESPAQGLLLLRRCTSRWELAGFARVMTGIMPGREWAIALLALLALLAVDALRERGVDVCDRLARASVLVRWPLLLFLLMAVLIFGLYGAGFDATAFMYAQF